MPTAVSAGSVLTYHFPGSALITARIPGECCVRELSSQFLLSVWRVSQLVCLLPCREVTHLALVKAETLPLSPILIFPPRVVGYFGELLAFSGSQFLHHH